MWIWKRQMIQGRLNCIFLGIKICNLEINIPSDFVDIRKKKRNLRMSILFSTSFIFTGNAKQIALAITSS